MGSPENPNESTTAIIESTTSPQSAAFQDSPVFNYINNLSPIKPVKGASVIQVFSGLNSPPLVFTSPRIHAYQRSIDLKRSTGNIATGAVEPERLTSHMSDLTPSANSSLTNAEDGLPKVADSMNPEGSIEIYANEDGKESNVVATNASPTFVEQANQDYEGNLSSCPKSVENDGKITSCVKSNSYQKVLANVSVDQTSSQRYDQRVGQNTQPVFVYKDCGKRIGPGISKESIVTMTERHSKVAQSQLGKRRRLQFETAQEKIVENDPGSENLNTAGKSEILDSCRADISSASHNIQLSGSTQSTRPLSLSQNTSRNASLTVSKPSGIGLHLNSIVNARPLACPLNVSVKPTDVTCSSAKSISISSHMQNNMQCPSFSSNSNLVEKVSATSEEYTHETPPSCPSYNNAKSKKIIEHEDKAGRVDELDRSNPKKRRKKTENTGDGCKHCNCKKSKCLKLYCDCFAAGIYCAGPCSCQGCFNRPEYEDTVLETRQQIESRNPLAFAPKIIHRLTQPPRSQIVEDGDQLTPLAGRHKRGCNCKKSMCLKKYCECYQANVGCSDGCRCEDCQNIYGKKGAVSGMIREMGMEVINEKLNDSFDDKLKVGSIRSRSSLPEFQKPHNLTPQTPSFQCSNHGNDASKARVLPGRYLPSPESESTFYPSYASTPRSPKDSATFDMITEASNMNSEMVPFGQELYPNVEFMDEFSPGCTNSGNATGHLTSMGDWSNSSRAQLLPPGGVSFSSLCFRGSSVTPVTLFGGTKLSDSQQKSNDIYDDDTPNMLKDSCTQPNKVKVTSPNKKRISPPRIRLHELGSNSLKSGRKFILKAVPSFPPLTPCIDSKDNTGRTSPADNTL
ncbi:hypothetical protein L6452_18548 [Arctium lappa]|uniref:Uncharacterized protein n=1 Tax=Arctium lappa TaxID=4217 RepID=A0ACB9C6I8_ARCLA|nr:hypothetical protein L6452_18548 [Arctium lappa]